MPEREDASSTDTPPVARKSTSDEAPPATPARRRGRPKAADVVAQLAELGGGVASLPDGPTDAYGLTPRQRRILETIKESV